MSAQGAPSVPVGLIEGLKRYGALKIILFGSAARGDADDFSDLDLVVLARTNRSFVERLGDVVGFIPPDSPPCDVLVYTPEEFAAMQELGNPFIEKVVAEGITLHEA
jgi:predicted nucleotidyltransferase